MISCYVRLGQVIEFLEKTGERWRKLICTNPRFDRADKQTAGFIFSFTGLP
jgi:hypothetical protein